MGTHVVLDLETLGTTPGSAIIQIGAVAFDPWGEGVSSAYQATVQLADAMKYGRVEAGTLDWWMDLKQFNALQSMRAAPVKVQLDEALLGFSVWYDSLFDLTQPIVRVWGNGAAFDNALLSAAYKATGLDRPWSYRVDRCFRTLKALAPKELEPVFEGMPHDALDDAKHQARWLQAIVRHLKLEAL